MREILFRGKRIDNGEWVEGFVCQDTIVCGNECCVKFVIHTPTENPFDDKWYEIEQNSISEFTGLTDKNGTKIFEGDIVKARFKPSNGGHKKCYAVGEVVFENGTFKICVYISSNTSEYKEFTDKNAKEYPIEHNFIDRGYKLEVLGNIYDNPEMLKG